MQVEGPNCLHDIGIVTSTGFSASLPRQEGVIILAQGTTDASIAYLPKGPIEAEVILAEGPTTTACIDAITQARTKKAIIIHNPMIAFWRRAVLYYETCEQFIAKGYDLRFEDYALVH